MGHPGLARSRSWQILVAAVTAVLAFGVRQVLVGLKDEVRRTLQPVRKQQRLLRGEEASGLGDEVEVVHLPVVVSRDREADVALVWVVVRASYREHVIDPDRGVVIDGHGPDDAKARAVIAHSVDCLVGRRHALADTLRDRAKAYGH